MITKRQKKYIAVLALSITFIVFGIIFLINVFGSPTGSSNGSSDDSDFPFFIFIPIYTGAFLPLWISHVNKKNLEAEEQNQEQIS